MLIDETGRAAQERRRGGRGEAAGEARGEASAKGGKRDYPFSAPDLATEHLTGTRDPFLPCCRYGPSTQLECCSPPKSVLSRRRAQFASSSILLRYLEWCTCFWGCAPGL